MKDAIEVDGRIGDLVDEAERIDADYRRKREELAG
jgi:uncharacterized small protein (DUF1192 family)